MFFTRANIGQNYNMEDLCVYARRRKQKFIEQADNRYKRKINNVVATLRRNIADKKVLLVGGPSGSGKTTTAKLVVKKLSTYGIKAVVVSMDNFFVNRVDNPVLPNGQKDFDNITALNLELFKKCMTELVRTNHTRMPIYDFITGVRTDNVTPMEVDENTLIVVEGIHSFNPLCLTDEIKDKVVKLFVCPTSGFMSKESYISPEGLRFIRRILRDFNHRGYSVKNTEDYWTLLRKREDEYIFPFRSTSDYEIDTTHTYEPFLYKHELISIAEKDKNAMRYIKSFEMPSDITKQDISKDSLIQEFLP